MRNETLERIIELLNPFTTGNPETYYLALEELTEKYSLTENEIHYIKNVLFD